MEDITTHPEFSQSLCVRFSDLSDDTIFTAPKSHVVQLMAMRVFTANKLKHFKYLLSLSESHIREKAKIMRDSIKQKKKNAIQPSSTTSSSYDGMSQEDLCKEYNK